MISRVGKFVRLAVMVAGFSMVSLGTSLVAQTGCPDGKVCLDEFIVADIEPIRTPETFGPQTEMEKLGQLLFCDHRLSYIGPYACASCHRPDHGFADYLPLSFGVDSRKGRRNTPTIYNVEDGTHLFWDGRSTSLEDQAVGPLTNPNEMNMKLPTLEMRLAGVKEYRDLFHREFRTPPDTRRIPFIHMVEAIASFERTIVSANSPFDQYVLQVCGGRVKDCPAPETAAGAEAAQKIPGFGVKEQKGMALFRGKARCVLCHHGPKFADNDFHNIGYPATPDGKYSLVKEGSSVDFGRFEESGTEGDIGKFRTPTLRNVEETWPYMHNGGIPDWNDLHGETDYEKKTELALQAVVKFFVNGGGRFEYGDGRYDPKPDPRMNPIEDWTEENEKHLIAFLRSLTGDKWLKKDDGFKSCPR